MAHRPGDTASDFRAARRRAVVRRDEPSRHRLRKTLRHRGARVETTGTVLAFDFGEKRIGVAVGDLSVRIAHPLTTISAEENARRFDEIAKLVMEWRPVRLVVGLPMHPDGTEHELSRLSRRFARRLEGRFALPVSLVDERFTSVAAESRLREAGAPAPDREKALDAAAASEILQSWLESAAAPKPSA